LIVSRLPAERGLRVLDIGSGQGDLAADLVAARPDLDVAGVELSAVGVRLAAEKVPSGRFRQVDLLHDAELPDELRGWARVAICAEVLEHLDDPARFLQRARELMAPGCRVIITVPAGPRSAYDRHIGHRRHYDVADLTALLRAAGLRVEHVRAAGFPFFNVYKGLVILRGERLIQDADFGDRGESLPVRAVSAAFRVLFRLNASKTPWGWQLVALATAPD
jgi:SAM-dependent methyltransferase